MSIRTCVILNPRAGRGRAASKLEVARSKLPSDAVIVTTERRGHAVELARQAALDGFDRVIAAGGDGTVHEVANGLLQSGRADVVLSTWPLGSSNDYARTLGMGRWWQAWPHGGELATLQADVGIIRAGNQDRYFVNGAGIGFNGMVTVEANTITWLNGMPLYTLAFLRAMRRHFAKPLMRIQRDGVDVVSPTLAVSFNLGQREGGFPVTWNAQIDDGLFETFHAADLRRWELIRYLPALLTGKLPTDHPQLRMGQCRNASVQCDKPLCVHTDGELVCLPHDAIYEVAIELLPKRLKVEFCPLHLYET